MIYNLKIIISNKHDYFNRSIQNMIKQQLYDIINIINYSKENESTIYIYEIISDNNYLEFENVLINILNNIEKKIKINYPEFTDNWNITFELNEKKSLYYKKCIVS
jgi:hypothetical protein